MKLDIMARSANNFVKIFLRRLSDDSEVAILIPPYLLVRNKQWANLPTLFADHTAACTVGSGRQTQIDSTKIGGIRGGTELGRVMSQDSATGK